MFGDINSLYPTIIAALLPVKEYYELLIEEVEHFNPENTPTDGISIDYYIPDEVKQATEDLLVSLKQEIITYEKLSPLSNKQCLISIIN